MKARKSLGAVRILRQVEQGGYHGQYRTRDRVGRSHATIRNLQALVYHGAMTPAGTLEVVDKAVHAAAEPGAKDKSQMEVLNVARGCLAGVREAIAEMMN